MRALVVYAQQPSFYPYSSPTLLPPIDQECRLIQANLNNGVYKCGLAKSQAAHEATVHDLFLELDRLEAKLAQQRFLCSSTQPTVANIQLLVTLMRFDDVYHSLFKCYKRRLACFHHLSNYMLDLLGLPKVYASIDIAHI